MSARADDTGGAFWGDVDDDVALDRYQTLVNTIDDGVYQLDSNGYFVAVNDVIVERTGYSREELVGAHVSLVLADDDAERIARKIATQLESEDPDVATIELGIQTADGYAVPCELRINLLIESGEFRGTIGVARDISEKKQRLDTLESARASYDSMTSVLDEANIGVFVLDDEFRVAWVDETIQEYFGRNRAELMGRDKRTVVHEIAGDVVADADGFAETVLATYDDNSYIEEFECRVTAGDDRPARWLEHRSKPIESGQYAGGRIELYYDITDRKRTEDARRESEERFRSLVDAVEEDAIVRLDSAGRVASWNEGATEIKGYDADEILGEHVSTFYTEADRAAGVPERNLERAIEAGSIEDEGWRVRADGSRFWASVTITAVLDEDGTPQGFLKITRDMTERHERERELESELGRILGRISDAFYGLDDEFRFTHVNERAEELLQYAGAELLGESLWDVFPTAAADEAVEDAFRTAMEDQVPTSYEQYFDGLDLWVEANLYPSETGISVYFRDISEQKRYERTLVTLQETARELLTAPTADAVGEIVVRAASDVLDVPGVVTYQYDDGRDVLVPAAESGDARFMRSEFPRVTPGEGSLTGHVYAEGEPRHFGNVLESGRVQVEPSETEMRAGSFVPMGEHGILVAGAPERGPFDDGTRRLLELLATNAEAAYDRVDHERKLAESKQRYQTLVENFPNGAVGLFDEDFRYSVVGGDLLEELSVSADELVDAPVTERLPTDAVDRIEPHLRGVFEGESKTIELELGDRDLLAHTLPVRDAADEIDAGMVVLQDVSERLDYRRRLEESNERLEQFAYAASHDLQEPLRMVTSYLRLIERRYGDALDEDAGEFLEFAVDGAERMREMIDGLLTYSRVETRGSPFEEIDLNAVLEDVREDLQLQIEERNAEITVETLPRVDGDAGQLRQLFQNLLSNAIAYSGDEPPRVDVTAERTGDAWVLSVRDRGVGIDPDEQDRVFEVFQRLHTHEDHPGTGIGLALCRRIVERHGGEIWIDSEPGEGTTVSFTLPAASEPDA